MRNDSFEHNGSGDDAMPRRRHATTTPRHNDATPRRRHAVSDLNPDASPSNAACGDTLADSVLINRDILENIFRNLGAEDLGAIAGVARAWRDEVERLRLAGIRRSAILGEETKTWRDDCDGCEDHHLNVSLARFMRGFAPYESVRVYHTTFFSPRFDPMHHLRQTHENEWPDVVNDINLFYQKTIDLNGNLLSPDLYRHVDVTTFAENLERLRNLAASFPSDEPVALPHLRNLTLWYCRPLLLTLRNLVVAAPNLEVLKVRKSVFPDRFAIPEFMDSIEKATNLRSFAFAAFRGEVEPLIEALLASRRDSLQGLFIYSQKYIREEYEYDIGLNISQFTSLKKLAFLWGYPVTKQFLDTLANGLGQILEELHVIINLKEVDDLLKFKGLKKLKARIDVNNAKRWTPNLSLFFTHVDGDRDHDAENENAWRQHPIESVDVVLMKGLHCHDKAMDPQPIVNYLHRRWSRCEEFKLEKNDESFSDKGDLTPSFEFKSYHRDCQIYMRRILKDFKYFG